MMVYSVAIGYSVVLASLYVAAPTWRHAIWIGFVVLAGMIGGLVVLAGRSSKQ